jgi:hypothetical protein
MQDFDFFIGGVTKVSEIITLSGESLEMITIPGHGIIEAVMVSGVDASLPYMWSPNSDGRGGKAVEDPGTIAITVDESRDEIARITLEYLVEDFIGALVNQVDGKVHGAEESKLCTDLSKHLRYLADKLDASVH